MLKHSLLTILFLLVSSITSHAGSIRDLAEEQIYSLIQAPANLHFSTIELDKKVKLYAEKKVRQRFFKDNVYTWKITRADSLIGIAILDNVKGKSMPITFFVVYDTSGVILGARVVKYRESIGGEIGDVRWLNQFCGKNLQSDFKAGADIDGISGATISVNAMTRGIKKLSILFPFIKNQLN